MNSEGGARDDERPWPPPNMARWLSRHTVNTDDLVDELHYWMVKMAGGTDEQAEDLNFAIGSPVTAPTTKGSSDE